MKDKVVGLIPKTKIEEENYRKDLLDIVDQFRKSVETGEINEFVIASLDSDGEVILTTCCKDLIGGIGLFEMGKNILLQQ